MPRPIGVIKILISSRVLFDLEEADRIFKKEGHEQYIDYMCARGAYQDDFDPAIGGRRLDKGPLWSFAEAILALNELSDEPVAELGVICKDDAETAVPLFRNLDVSGLALAEFRIALAGHKTHPSDLEAFDTDLFLTRNPKDTQMAVDAGYAAATINFPPQGKNYNNAKPPVRIWVDGDAVAFDSSIEVEFKTKGLSAVRKTEGRDFNQPLGPGPFTKVLAKISELNARFPRSKEPFEISLLTSRGGDVVARAFNTAASHGIKFNGRMYCMGGIPKIGPLKAHRPDLFIDDQALHLKEAKAYCPTGLVAYPKGSPMYEYLKALEKQENANDNKNNDDQAPPIAPSGPSPSP